MSNKRMIALLLTLVMVFTMLPTMAIAEGLDDFQAVPSDRLSTSLVKGVQDEVSNGSVVYTVNSKADTSDWDQNSGVGSVDSYTYVGVYVDVPENAVSLKMDDEGVIENMEDVDPSFIQDGKFQHWFPIADKAGEEYSLFAGGREYKLLLEWFNAEEESIKKEYVDVTRNIGEDLIVAKIGSKTYESLQGAIAAASANDVIELTQDTVLNSAVTIDKNITIKGNNHAIKGNEQAAQNCFEVTGGTFTIEDVTLKNFGGAAGTQSGLGVIKVPETAGGDVKVVAKNVNLANFNRSAYDLGAGSFEITGGMIDCANSNTENTRLTKGIKVGGTDKKVTGTITNVAISNSESKYEDWDTGAIEVYNNADVDITGCTINNVKLGVSVDNYYYDTKGDVTVDIFDSNIAADSRAVRIYSKEGAAANAAVNIAGGEFNGEIKIINKTEKDTISITGGYFTANPSEYVAEDHVVLDSDKSQYDYMVEEKGVNSAEVVDAVIPTPEVSDSIAAEDQEVAAEIGAAINADVVAGEGLNTAAATVANKNTVTAEEGKSALEEASISVGEHDTVEIVVQPTMEIEITSVDSAAKSYTVSINPMYQTIATTDKDGIDIGTNAVVLETKPLEITKEVTVVLPIPSDFEDVFNGNAYVKHLKDGNFVAYHKANVSDSKITFVNDKGFSDFIVLSDTRSVTVDFGDYASDETYELSNIGDQFPTANKENKKFRGWSFANVSGIYTSLTEELWDKIATIDGQTVTATAVFASSSGGGTIQQKTLTFDTNGGSKIDAVTANYGKTIVLADYVPKKAGYNFVGWYKDSALKEKIEYAVLDYDMTVYAKWSLNGEPTEDEGTVETKIILAINDKVAVIDGKAVSNDVPPLIVNNRTYTPVRFVAEALGAEVEWNEASRTVTIKKDDVSIVLTVDSAIAYVNGEKVQMDASAFIADGRIFTPARFVAENLGADVQWDDITKTVVIVKYAQ